MAMMMCPKCDGTIVGGIKHKCDEDKLKLKAKANEKMLTEDMKSPFPTYEKKTNYGNFNS